MCKTRFGSQGVILDGFSAKKKLKNLNGTRDPPPLWKIPLKFQNLFLEYFPIDKQQTGAFSENYESNCLYDISNISRYQNAPSHANFLYSRLILC